MNRFEAKYLLVMTGKDKVELAVRARKLGVSQAFLLRAALHDFLESQENQRSMERQAVRELSLRKGE